jgi:hypothetical protein
MDLLDFLLESLKLVDVVLLLGWVILNAVLCQLSDFHAVILQQIIINEGSFPLDYSITACMQKSGGQYLPPL